LGNAWNALSRELPIIFLPIEQALSPPILIDSILPIPVFGIVPLPLLLEFITDSPKK
jgi:hypothetical protein